MTHVVHVCMNEFTLSTLPHIETVPEDRLFMVTPLMILERTRRGDHISNEEYHVDKDVSTPGKDDWVSTISPLAPRVKRDQFSQQHSRMNNYDYLRSLYSQDYFMNGNEHLDSLDEGDFISPIHPSIPTPRDATLETLCSVQYLLKLHNTLLPSSTPYFKDLTVSHCLYAEDLVLHSTVTSLPEVVLR